MRLVQHYGGLPIHIPKRARGKLYDELLRLIGADSTSELVRVFGGESLYVAKDAKAAKAIHQRAIAEKRAAGLTWREVAKSYSFITTFSERWVRKLASDADPAAQRQPSLFDIPAPHPLDILSRRI